MLRRDLSGVPCVAEISFVNVNKMAVLSANEASSVLLVLEITNMKILERNVGRQPPCGNRSNSLHNLLKENIYITLLCSSVFCVLFMEIVTIRLCTCLI